jgi:hypothetical protein
MATVLRRSYTKCQAGYIEWTLAGTVTNGLFCNGDIYVVGPVTPTGRDPARIAYVADSTWGTRVVNSSQINPVGNTTHVGIDSGLYGLDYDVALDAEAGGYAEIPAGSSYISVRSRSTIRSFTDDAAILTVLAAAPAAGSFRPPYSGTDKTVLFNESELDYSWLGNFDKTKVPSAVSTTTLDDMAHYFDRPYLDWPPENAGEGRRNLHPARQFDSVDGYGYHMAEWAARLFFHLNLDYTQAQKRDGLVNLVQLGLDITALYDNGTIWMCNGGHFAGRKLPVLIAGLSLTKDGLGGAHDAMIDHMRDVANWTTTKLSYYYTKDDGTYGTQTGAHVFQDDSQYFYVNKLAWDITGGGSKGTTRTGAPAGTPNWNPYDSDVAAVNILGYTEADSLLPLPEFGIRHETEPARDNRHWTAAGEYRQGNTNNVCVPISLALRMTTGGKAAWGHPEFFDYADRYADIECPDWTTAGGYVASSKAAGSNWTYGGNYVLDYYTEAWQQFRSDLDEVLLAPPAPASITVTNIRSTSAHFAWPAAARASGYRVYNGDGLIGEGVGLTADITGFTASSPYTVWVTAWNPAGESDPSPSEDFNTHTADSESLAPTPPSNLSGFATGYDSIFIFWTSNSNNELLFKIKRDGVVIDQVPAGVTWYADLNRTASTAYAYQVCAYNGGGGDSAYTDAVNITTNPLPPPEPEPAVVLPTEPQRSAPPRCSLRDTLPRRWIPSQHRSRKTKAFFQPRNKKGQFIERPEKF